MADGEEYGGHGEEYDGNVYRKWWSTTWQLSRGPPGSTWKLAEFAWTPNHVYEVRGRVPEGASASGQGKGEGEDTAKGKGKGADTGKGEGTAKGKGKGEDTAKAEDTAEEKAEEPHPEFSVASQEKADEEKAEEKGKAEGKKRKAPP
eukprot:1861045-Lingulodinium_polyedra.AAC.1